MVLTPEQELAQKSFRNLERVHVLPVEMVGVADIVGAAQLVLSQEAVDVLTARARAPKAKETV